MAEYVKFEVAAKTARLIGRENITNVYGAVLELVKNSYDADASFCYLLFDIPFLSVQNEYDISFLKSILSNDDLELLSKYFEFNETKNVYCATREFDSKEVELIQSLLNKYNKIIILDNGFGMDAEIIKKFWMKIGTNNKEKNYLSAKGRVKTGAKGIGRFALDKLSTNTILYSKMPNKKMIRWQINWESFENVENLSEINASLEELDVSISEIVNKFIGSADFLKDKDIENGTMIILTPTRESWTNRLFLALNNNLSGLNPLQNLDKFDVCLDNVFYPQYSFLSKDLKIDEKDYDYYIDACYDGDDGLTISIKRNELDTTADSLFVKDEYTDLLISFNASDFWSREAINREGFKRDDYSKERIIHYKASNFLGVDGRSLKNLGKFNFNFYFLKNGNSELSIVKKISKKRRNDIINSFSGIKIYRDSFKVRPYGEKDSPLFDWLNLSSRGQKSPAAVTNLLQPWRVEPYQLIGQLFISRNNNPLLYDTANREGLTQNDSYLLLVDILTKIIKEFENDRQLYLREFKKVTDAILSKNKDIVRQIIQQSENKRSKTSERSSNKSDFSKEDYNEAVDFLVKKQKDTSDDYSVIYSLCTSGLTTNTFAHELSYPASLLNSAASQLILCLNRITDETSFKTDDIYNPYKIIKNNRGTEKIISSWISTLLNGIKPDALERKKIDIVGVINKCVKDWKELLDSVFINIKTNSISEHIMLDISSVDIFLILNNFIINSVWFLDGCNDKEIFINLIEDDKNIIIQMENNGPSLNSDYINNPYQIFELRESKKEDRLTGEKIGTGVGLWMVKMVVEKYNGEIFFHNLKNNGFGFSIKLSKE